MQEYPIKARLEDCIDAIDGLRVAGPSDKDALGWSRCRPVIDQFDVTVELFHEHLQPLGRASLTQPGRCVGR